MTNKEWMDANTEWLEAIRNETPVMVSDDNEHWEGPYIPRGFACNPVCKYLVLNTYRAYWKPAPKKISKAKGPVEIMKALVKNGYEPDNDGFWVTKGFKIAFAPKMWKECGRDISKSEYKWEPEWTEDVEVEE